MDNIKTGNLIKEARKAKGLTQKELADKLSVTDRAVSKWERGLNAPDISLLQPLSQALDISIAQLVGGENDDEENSENAVKNIISYSENQMEQKRRENRTQTFLKFYGVVIVLLFAVSYCTEPALKRLAEYAGYDILIAYGINWNTYLVGFYLVFGAPLWGTLLLLQWSMYYRKNPFTIFVECLTHLVAIILILVLAYDMVSAGLEVKTRYEHLVKLGNERYEMTEIDWFPRIYHYDTGKNIDSITYIYDGENPDSETEEYLKDVISRQPLKIYKLEKQKAPETMAYHSIDQLPAVVIIRQGNVEILEGYEEISLLESKIHSYKQNNIYFY